MTGSGYRGKTHAGEAHEAVAKVDTCNTGLYEERGEGEGGGGGGEGTGLHPQHPLRRLSGDLGRGRHSPCKEIKNT